MTEQISNTELDELTAEHIMGWHVENRECNQILEPFWVDADGHSHHRVSSWHPSRKIALAWQVLAKFPFPFCRVQLMTTVTGKWLCEIILNSGDGPVRDGAAQTAPRAIALASLRAVGVEVNK